MRASVEFGRGAFDTFRKHSIQRLERAAMNATDRASRDALRDVRTAMSGASLGRLGGAIKQFSDKQKGKVFRRGSEAFSASGGVAIRTRNERTVGAIKSYTEGSEIRPVRSEWLWFSTGELGIKRVNRFKLTPALYRAAGLESKIGPLIKIPGRHSGEVLLIVRNVSTPLAAGRARRLPKNGKVRGARQAREFIVAFIGIKRTSRDQRVDVREIMRVNASRVGPLVIQELQKG